MEEINFEEWVKSLDIREALYFAVYDEHGNIITVAPTFDAASIVEENKLQIDKELARNIINGTENIFYYKINLIKKEIYKINELVELQGLKKIDNVLHRIIEDKWSTVDKPDLSILCKTNDNNIEFTLSEKFNGVFWEGETEMLFLITDYNDPNILWSTIAIRAGDITGQSKIINNINFPVKFSIYTRRVFESYTVTII
jgi:hypothetical protein